MTRASAVWALLDGRQRRELVALQLLSLVMALTTLIGIAAVLPFFSLLAAPDTAEASRVFAMARQYLPDASRRELVALLGALLVAVVLVANLVNYFGLRAIARFSQGVGNRFHTALLHHYLSREYGFHAARGAAALAHNVLYATSRIGSGIIESTLVAVTHAVTVVFIVASVVWVSPWVGTLAALWVGASYLAVYFAARRRLLENGRLENLELANRARLAHESLGAIKEVLLRARQAHFVQLFAASCRRISGHVLSVNALTLAPRYAMEVAVIAGLVVAAVYLSAGGAGQLAQLTFLGFAAYRLLPATQQLFAAVTRVRANWGAFEGVAVDLAAALGAEQVPVAVATPMDPPQRAIELAGVTFTYPGAAAPALRDVTLRIPAGAMVGVVGANGAGKTTLVDVLLGLLHPDAGELRVDGRVVDAQRLPAWRAKLAYVPQDVYLLDASIAANIAFGVAPADVDAARLARAARLAQLEPLVASLPLGLDSPVGDRGRSLSGGQRQRIGIARALYLDAAVIALDEGTSALDGLAEHEIVAVLAALRGRCTLVLIAHRAGGLRACDIIVRMEAGRVVEVTDDAHAIARSAVE
jgi:ATP-binding cassette, subfamily B, bacterial PglK